MSLFICSSSQSPELLALGGLEHMSQPNVVESKTPLPVQGETVAQGLGVIPVHIKINVTGINTRDDLKEIVGQIYKRLENKIIEKLLEYVASQEEKKKEELMQILAMATIGAEITVDAFDQDKLVALMKKGYNTDDFTVDEVYLFTYHNTFVAIVKSINNVRIALELEHKSLSSMDKNEFLTYQRNLEVIRKIIRTHELEVENRLLKERIDILQKLIEEYRERIKRCDP